MNEHYLYMWVNALSASVPFLFSFHPKWSFYKTWYAFFPAMAITAALFIGWDMAYTDMGIWGFNPRYLTGLHIGNLPLEECLFFVAIPYACMFSYHASKYFHPQPFSGNLFYYLSWFILVLMLVVAISVRFRWYTSITATSLCASLILVFVLARKEFTNRFLLVYAFILIPFFVVNGVLTGTGIDEEVVWYDNTQNLGIRIGTIPIEDIFYGMLLILINVVLYEYFLHLGKHPAANWKNQLKNELKN